MTGGFNKPKMENGVLKLKNSKILIFDFSTLNFQRGIIIEYVLVFGAIFLILISGLLGFILFQLRQANMKVSWEEALDVAEGGMNYYRWCLNNEVEAQCAGERDFFDAEGKKIGRFNVTATATIYCGLPGQRRITVTGWTDQFPTLARTIKATYAQKNVAQYSYILHSNVWVGNDHNIHGPYHSDGGIRMDGSNQSLITSAAILDGQGAWKCNDSFGCSPCPTQAGQCRVVVSDCVCPGVFTTTSNPTTSLFQYPVSPFDFAAITIDLGKIKDKAWHAGGIYLPKSTDLNPSGKGYHLKFQSNGTVQAWVVTGTSRTWGCSNDCTQSSDWQYDYFTISSEYLYNTYTIPPECSAIFTEDNMWPEGVISGKVVAASANLIDTSVDTDVILNKNITYTHDDGSDGVLIIGERNVLIGPSSPDVMELRGVFTAQKGHFGRNYYQGNMRTSLTIYGSIVSNGRVGTRWTSGGTTVSGYAQRETYYDQYQVDDPPPFIPSTNPDYKIVTWDEVE